MNRQWLVIALVALAPACGKKSKPLGDKKTACDNIYSSYRSHQDPKVWADACMAAPDETVRCVNLIMDEGKDSACMKAVKSPERTKLVTVLNGTPEAATETPAAGSGSAAAPEGAAVPEGMVSLDLSPFGDDFKDIKIAAPKGATLKLAKNDNGANEIVAGDSFQMIVDSGDTDLAGQKREWQKNKDVKFTSDTDSLLIATYTFNGTRWHFEGAVSAPPRDGMSRRFHCNDDSDDAKPVFTEQDIATMWKSCQSLADNK